MFTADLHIHSRFSRACSKDCDIEHLSWWARRKGLSVLGTGDFTHPAWAAELKDTLVEAEPGLFRVRPELERRLDRDTPATCAGPVRFMLSVEISTIYRRDERTRKVHHLLYAPSFEAADRITAALAKIGNLASDGRPILGLDSRDLLEITLEAGPGCFLVPAHVWTPWFAVLGSKSGFDAVRDCYADLADHIFAVETGLSSDPAMNWTCSSLDAYRLVSNSDAHSPPMLGREATVFGTGLDYFAMAEALRTGAGLAGTLEFFPEEGKYHLDGHRKCGVRIDPEQSTALEDRCPACGKPLTIGVLHRVAELADRPAGFRPDGAAGFTCLVQLPQIVGEIFGTGPKSKKVTAEVGRLAGALGPELSILREVPLDDLRRVGGTRFAEAIGRLRRGEVIREAGYDGEYGTIRLFQPDELDGSALFATTDLAAPAQAAKENQWAERNGVPAAAPRPRARRGGAAAAPASPGTGSVLDGLDPAQRAAATADGPLLIIAGPGTGKTRTLTHRIAYQIAELGRPAGQFLAITFTRRAAQEMRDRLAGLGAGADLAVTTFHGLGLRILREHAEAAGLPPGFGVADEAAVTRVAAELGGSEREGRRLQDDPAGRQAVRAELIARGLVDFDGLTELAAALLGEKPEIAAGLRSRWPFVSVDEYQDIDPVQYELVRALAGNGAGLTAIGDPDQAIYGFRGADVGIFGRFAADFPGATTVELTRNYRSSPAIVTAALQAIAPATLVPSRAAAVASAARPAGALAAAARGPGRRQPVRGGGRARRGGLDRGRHRPAAGRGLVPLAGQRAGRRARPRQAGPVRHRGAVPDRRAGRRARPGADPGRAALPEALARPAGPAARRGRPGARDGADSAGRGCTGPADGGRAGAGRRPRREGRHRGRYPGRGRGAGPAGPPVRGGRGTVPDRDLARRRGRRAGPAGRGDHPADPARGQGPGVRRGVPGRLRTRPAAAALARIRAADAGRDGRGTPAAVRRDDPGPQSAGAQLRGPADPAWRRGDGGPVAVPRLSQLGTARPGHAAAGATERRPPVEAALKLLAPRSVRL